jgi:hypothetical protein
MGVWRDARQRNFETRTTSMMKNGRPNERHDGKATAIMTHRHAVYQHAKACTPHRWGKRETRDWSLPKEVWLSPPASDEMEMREAA